MSVTNFPGVSISYKETTICETQAKAWAGYVNMPTSYLKDIEGAEPYNISMFFWYFQARESPNNAVSLAIDETVEYDFNSHSIIISELN